MNNVHKKSLRKGFGLVEIVVGSSVISLAFLAIFGFFNSVLPFVRLSNETTQVNYILDEGVEVMKLMRDEGWSANIAPLSATTSHALNFSADAWSITTGDDVIDSKFHRSITVSDVYRDGNDDIAASGTFDPGTKKITVTVDWLYKNSTTTRTLSTYITDLYAN